MSPDVPLHGLASDLVHSRRTGKPLLRIGFQAQFFFRSGDTREIRNRAVEVLTAFARDSGGQVTHVQKHNARRMTRMEPEALSALLHAEVDVLDPAVDLHGPHVGDGRMPPAWQGTAMLQPTQSSLDLSSLSLAMPEAVVRKEPTALLLRLRSACTTLQPLHGTAGLAPVMEIGMQLSAPDDTWPLLSRYAGLDFLAPFPMAARGLNRIQGVNWLTVLGAPMLAELGGKEALADRLEAASVALALVDVSPALRPEILDFDGGVIIRAGPYPEMGDVEAGGPPLSYRVVAKALRPWRFREYENRSTRLLKVPKPLDALTETLRWTSRFDDEWEP